MTDVATTDGSGLHREMVSATSGAMRSMRRRLTGVSVRSKMLGIVVSLALILGLGATWQVRSVMGAVLVAELDNRGTSVVSDVAARSTDSYLLGDVYAVYEILEDVVANHQDVEYAYVVTADGEVPVHTFGEHGVPVGLLELDGGTMEEDLVHRHFEGNSAVYHEFTAGLADRGMGVVHVGLSEERLNGIVNGITTQMLITTLLVAVVAMAAASLLTWLLTRPILALVETTREVRDGNLSVRSVYRGDDEIGTLSLAFNQMVGDLEINREVIAKTEETRTRLVEKLIFAQEEERKRLARELHDSVGQSLSSLMIGIPVLAGLSGDEADTKSVELQLLTGETLGQVREMSRELRPSVLDDLGLEAALERYAEDLVHRYPGIVSDVQGHLADRLDPTIETGLYRIVQEAMTNAARHGSPKHISIVLAQKRDSVRVIVEDDGVGFDSGCVMNQRVSVGLHAMQERAELLGGTFVIESGYHGTAVFVEVPV